MGTPLHFEAPLDEWKLVYRILHGHLREHLDLMDADVFSALQVKLQAAARAAGIDVTDHAAWDRWLGHVDVPSCEARVEARGLLD